MSPTEAQIKRDADLSVVFGLFGVLCCGLLVCPFAISYANRARDAIYLEDVGHQYLTRANLGHALGLIGIGAWLFAGIVYLIRYL